MALLSDTTLEDLMARYAEGDEVAFGEFYRRTAGKLFGHIVRQCRDEALAEDVLQTAYAKVHRARESYVRGAPVVPWLLVITRRCLYDEIRSARARGEVLSADGVLPEPPAPDPLARDEARHLRRVLSELPGQYLEAITLTKLHGLSGGEAAKVLSTTESAVKLRVHRGYQLLRRRLQEAEAA